VAATEQRDEPATVRQPHLIGVSTELKALSISTYSKISDAFIICIAYLPRPFFPAKFHMLNWPLN